MIFCTTLKSRFDIFLILRYVSQWAVKVFMKWSKLRYEALDVAMDDTLVEEASWVSLSHELEETSDDIGVREFLGQDMVHS
jgi:hypothetical protein